MDTVNNWKKILLQWIKKCNFLELSFYNIEQSDIEIFFSKFKECITEDLHNKDLCYFLRENYPSFEPHFDDENALSSSDYVYVYSLLLHYSCVKYPNEFFQQKCQELDESIQQDIATFFKKIFELENLSKQSLRHVIASTAMSPCSTIQLMFTDSPIKTPRKNDISPQTPRSCMLRERNKELYNLKTQLENEIYEKGMLELEVKQSQEKIFKLCQDLKKSHHEIENLRNDIMSRSIESNLVFRNSEDQVNRKLCKEVSQKELEITRQREDIDALTEEKNTLKEKLAHAKKQIRIDQIKIEELAMKIDELLSELEQKEQTIHNLSEEKLELQQHISENRSSSASLRPDLNVSAECLDVSRTTNSSGSINSPENLGYSVVDVQLREKESENIQLRDELRAFRLNNLKLSTQINAVTAKYSTFFEGESVVLNQETTDPLENFLIFSNYLEKFFQKYEENNIILNDLREYSKKMENEKRSLSSNMVEMENFSSNLKAEINNCVAVNETLKKKNIILENDTKEWESRLSNNIKESDALLQQKNQEISELKEKNKNLMGELNKLKQTLNILAEERDELQNKNEKIKNVLADNNRQLQKSIDELKYQQTLVSMLDTEKNALLINIQLGLDTFKSVIDNIDTSLSFKICKLVEEKEVLLKKLPLVESKCQTQEKQLNEFTNIISELKSKLEEVFQKHKLVKPSVNQLELSLVQVAAHSLVASNTYTLQLYINTLVQELQKLFERNTEKDSQIANAIENIKEITIEKKDIEDKMVSLERRNLELRETFESEKQCAINKLTNEVQRLKEDITNIESVCDHLTNQNTSLQTKLTEYQELIDQLTEENTILSANNSFLENERSRQLSTADKLINTESELRNEVQNMQITVKKLEFDIEGVQKLLVTKTKDVEVLSEERYKADKQIESMKKYVTQLESKISMLETSLKNMTDKYDSSNKLIEKVTLEQCCNIGNLNEKLQNETLKKNEIIVQMNQFKKEKIVLNEKLQTMETELSKYKTDLECSKTKLQKMLHEEAQRTGEIKNLNENNLLNDNRIEKLKKELFEQKQNVSQLIKEMSSMRKEKDNLREENYNLQKRLEEKNCAQTLLNSQYQASVEKLKVMENELLAKQSSFNSEQLKSIDLENQLTKLQMENLKLKETAANNIKRMEKQALKLGETQAKSLKFKKETELALSNLEMLKSSSETTQRENSRLNFECKSLKEKLTKFEKTFDQLESKLQKVERENDILRTEKENIETAANVLKLAKTSLENNKPILEDKIRKLAKSLSDANAALSRLEQEKVTLNLEIGAINTELNECKSLLSFKTKEVQNITQDLSEVKNTNLKLTELNEKLQVNASEIRDENIRLNDELSKLSLRLSIIQEKYDSTASVLEKLRLEVIKKNEETEAIEKEFIITNERLKKIEEIVDEKVTSELMEKNIYLEQKIEKLSSEIRYLEEVRKQDMQTNERLNTDISILQAKLHKSRLLCEENEKKWKEEKEELLSEVKASEDRIKETRLELEGKLEKMKTKMKTLYNEEIAKMKKKQEREMNLMTSECDSLKAQNDKYEENTKKLAGQIFRLNENILEYQKQNTFLQTKLKDFEAESHKVNRVVSTHVPQSHSNHHVLGPNLHMEDEEGEVFNNTYLSDLKTGKMPEVFGKGISPQELQHRNSLRPPHLKTAYFAQYDHQMGEDEIRDVPNLDDSLSTLLNTGQRKKISGATSYKRPGPPTPSKNAGRLSFGGNGEPNREILRETFDVASNHNALKTPAKFKLFSSKHSIKDEYNNCMTNHLRRNQILGTIQCSSTPRKSKAHFDQRRILDQLMSAAHPGCETFSDSYNTPDANFPYPQTYFELLQKKTQKYNARQCKLSRVSTESETSELRSNKYPHDKLESDSKFKSRRYSINLKGSMFARTRRNSKRDFREVNKNRSVQRSTHFNKYRCQILSTFAKTSKRPSLDVTNETMDSDCDELHTKNSYTRSTNAGINVINNDAKSSIEFKKLLVKKVSQAPFRISEIFPSMNANSSGNIDSRTVYGTSVIFNRRIPSVNTTHARKSSIYVKSGDGNGIILVTNQTITLMDLAQMWSQMNTPAKLVTCMSLTTLCIPIILFLLSFFAKLT